MNDVDPNASLAGRLATFVDGHHASDIDERRPRAYAKVTELEGA